MMGTMESKGISDIKIAGLYDLAQWDDGRRMHLKLGLNLPTGSIDEKHEWQYARLRYATWIWNL